MALAKKGYLIVTEAANVAAIIALIVLLGFSGNLLGEYQKNKNSNHPQVSAAQSFTYDGQEDKTALDILKTKANIKVQESSIGTFITSINDVANSQDHFWLFYVNGSLSSMGADQYHTKTGDKIEWRYELIQ